MSLEQISRFRVAEVNKHRQIHLGGSAQQVVNRKKLLFNRNNYQFSNKCKLVILFSSRFYFTTGQARMLSSLPTLYAQPTTGQAPYYGHNPHNARLLSVST
ncbi:uncharacterized protein [Primulina eburnea]|uniref:uncharacterized protein isoform X1 n=1 Tax=Primulina eburnea TaxID=1245227 RepID=UPI003C6BD88F